MSPRLSKLINTTHGGTATYHLSQILRYSINVKDPSLSLVPKLMKKQFPNINQSTPKNGNVRGSDSAHKLRNVFTIPLASEHDLFVAVALAG